MKRLVYILVMLLSYPIWGLASIVTDLIYSLHKTMVRWVEENDK